MINTKIDRDPKICCTSVLYMLLYVYTVRCKIIKKPKNPLTHSTSTSNQLQNRVTERVIIQARLFNRRSNEETTEKRKKKPKEVSSLE